MHTRLLFAENILLTVDGQVYGTIVPPPGGFATQDSKLQLYGAEKWRSGSVMAPLDKEVYKSIFIQHCVPA